MPDPTQTDRNDGWNSDISIFLKNSGGFNTSILCTWNFSTGIKLRSTFYYQAEVVDELSP